MCEVCTEAVDCVALWTQVTLRCGHVWSMSRSSRLRSTLNTKPFDPTMQSCCMPVRMLSSPHPKPGKPHESVRPSTRPQPTTRIRTPPTQDTVLIRGHQLLLPLRPYNPTCITNSTPHDPLMSYWCHFWLHQTHPTHPWLKPQLRLRRNEIIFFCCCNNICDLGIFFTKVSQKIAKVTWQGFFFSRIWQSCQVNSLTVDLTCIKISLHIYIYKEIYNGNSIYTLQECYENWPCWSVTLSKTNNKSICKRAVGRRSFPFGSWHHVQVLLLVVLWREVNRVVAALSSTWIQDDLNMVYTTVYTWW